MKHYFQKYGIACMIGLVIFVLILPVQVFAAGEDSSLENSRTEDNMTETDLEKTQEETEQKIWELTEIKDLDTAIRKLFPEEKLHFQDLVESVIRQDENLSAGQIRNFVTDQFFYVLKVNKPVLASIIFLVLIAAVFSNFFGSVSELSDLTDRLFSGIPVCDYSRHTEFSDSSRRGTAWTRKSDPLYASTLSCLLCLYGSRSGKYFCDRIL